MSLPTRVLYYGKDEALPDQIPLRAGPLSLVYENGDLRYVKLGDQELLRRVYVAVRDHNWGTVPSRFSKVQMQINDDSFQIAYTVDNQQADIDFRWRGLIHGDNQGTITFEMVGEAHSTFLRNRIGICLLHPMTVAGAPARIEHVDGQTETNNFPVHIAPQLVVNGEIKPVIPFNEMRAVAHEVSPGLWAEVRFSGDIFEMEDQRNWTDASYKTYSTPLRLPFPAEVKQGDKIVQSVTLRLLDERPTTNDQPDISQTAAKPVAFEVVANQPSTPLPCLGLGIASHGQASGSTEITRLRALNLAHLRVDLKLAQPDYGSVLQQATAEARALGVTLDVALHLTDAAEAELTNFTQLLQTLRPPLSTWLIFHEREKTTSERWVQLARPALAGYDPTAKIGAGTNVYFTELNRSRPPVQALDVVAYSFNPQVHAFDNNSLVETLAAQAATVASARQFCGNLPLLIGPVTLQPRFNPNATGPEPAPGAGALPPQVDPRQMSLFGAGWTLGSIKYLAKSDVASITYYETTGWRGVMETSGGSPAPEKFRSIPGAVFPLYHLLADVGEFKGGEVLPTLSSDSLRVEGLVLRKDGHTAVLLANLTNQPQTVTMTELAATFRLRTLDETNAEAAMRAPEAFRAQTGELKSTVNGKLELTLLPYSIARVDFG
ncbi:MAG: hypothetical protein U0350_38985 [Caldilineaceae bacterium]